MPLHWWVEERLLAHAAMPERCDAARLAGRSVWREMERRTALCVEQAADGRIPRGSFAESGDAGHRRRSAGSPPKWVSHLLDGRMAADSFEFWRQLIAPVYQRCRHQPSLPVLPGLSGGWRSARTPRAVLDEWQVEWKWDGIRAQLILRRRQTFPWSQGVDRSPNVFPNWKPAPVYCPRARRSMARCCPGRMPRPLPFGAGCSAVLAARCWGRRYFPRCWWSLVAYDLLGWKGRRCGASVQLGVASGARLWRRIALPQSALVLIAL